MAKMWKTLKIFISSTFLDLELARDRMAHVFHNIEKELLSRQLTLRPYDLRWNEREHNQPLVDWCLEMVERCRYFVGILGGRYGWRPPVGAGSRENIDRLSITEMEIEYALAHIDPQCRFFCIDENTISKDSPQDQTSMAMLKKRLIDGGESVYHYRTIDQLLEIIDREMRARIDEEFPAGELVEPDRYTYQQALDEMVAEKIRGFVGRGTYLDQLQKFAISIDGDNYLAICARAGTGKSALLAKFMAKPPENIAVIGHYMKMSGDSNTTRAIMQNLAEQLHHLRLLDEIETDPAQLKIQIDNTLQKMTTPLIMVIDGLDEMDSGGRNLSWLPRNLPSHIRVILSTRPVDTWQKLQSYPHLIELELPPLDNEEIQQIIADYVEQQQLALDENDCRVLRQRAAGNPLFLKVALEELSASGMAVGQLATTVEALFDQILIRLYDKHGRELVDLYLGTIAAGKTGVLEKELAEILKVEETHLLTLTKALSNFVITRRNLLDFFHPEFERTIMIRMGKSGMREYHGGLARYFASKGYLYMRTVDELPHQLLWSEQYSLLLATLTDIEFIEKKCAMGMAAGLLQDFQAAVTLGAVCLPEDICYRDGEVEVNASIIRLLRRALENDLQFVQHHSQSVFQFLWNRGYWHDSIDTGQFCSNIEQAPWNVEQCKISSLVELWRKKKESQIGFTWLQTLGPVPQRLDSPLIKILRGHTQALESVQFSPDGTKLVSASWDQSVRIWDVETGEVIYVLPAVKRVWTACFSADGKLVAAGSGDGAIRVWDADSGELVRKIDGHERGIRGIDFSKNGKWIISGASDATMRIWEVASGNLIRELVGHQKMVLEAKFSPDDSKIASCSSDGDIRLWDSATGECLKICTGHTCCVESIDFHPDGSKLVSSSLDKTARLWDCATGKFTLVLEHKDQVRSAVFSPDGQKIVTGSDGKLIQFWHAEKGKLLRSFPGHETIITSAVFSPDGNLIASSGGADKSIRMWDLRTKDRSFNYFGHSNKVHSVEFSHDGQMMVSAARDNLIHIWDAQTAKIIRTFSGHEKWVSRAVFGPDDQKIASSSYDRTLKIWDVQTGNLLRTMTGHKSMVRYVDFCSDGGKIVSASSDRTVRLWDIDTGEQLSCFEEDQVVFCAAGSFCGTQVATGLADGRIHVWDIESGAIVHTFRSPKKEVHSIAFSADNNQVISVAMDRKVRFWDLKTGKSVDVVPGLGNARAIADDKLPYRVIVEPWKITIEDKKNKKNIAAFPGAMQGATISQQNIVAAHAGNHVYLMKLHIGS